MHRLAPETADRVLSVAAEAIMGKLARSLDSLAYEIAEELDADDRPRSEEIAESAARLLGYTVDR
uniref:hypothetical protein n=1 Tax=Amycolatopsis sp. CA-096443 TaxID=3239919 RepID=UPI003F492044